jgi:hypothetical protein
LKLTDHPERNERKTLEKLGVEQKIAAEVK